MKEQKPVVSDEVFYMVNGGIFTDTTFTDIVPGTAEVYGPFDTYQEAYDAWSAGTWKNVDICEHRLFIHELELDAGY